MPPRTTTSRVNMGDLPACRQWIIFIHCSFSPSPSFCCAYFLLLFLRSRVYSSCACPHENSETEGRRNALSFSLPSLFFSFPLLPLRAPCCLLPASCCLLLLLLLLLLPMAAARDAHQRRIGTLSGMRRRCFSDIARASYGIRLSGVCRPSREGCRRTSRGAGTLRFAATVPARQPPHPPARASSCLDAPRGGLFAAVRIYAQRPRAANLRDRVVMGLFTRRAWGVRARVPAHQRRGDPLRHTGPSPGGTAAACDGTHARTRACVYSARRSAASRRPHASAVKNMTPSHRCTI